MAMHSQMSTWRADMYLLMTTLLAGLGWIFSKEVVAVWPPLLFLGVRFFLGGVLLLPFAWSAVKQLTSSEFKIILRVGLLFACGMVLWMFGLAHAQHLGVGAFLNTLAIVLVPLIALAYGERPSVLVWLALPLALLGMALLFLENQFALGIGELAFLAAAVVFALNFTLNSQAAYHLPILALTALQLIIVGVVGLLLSAGLETWSVQTFQQPASLWLWLALSILVSTSGRFLLQTKGQALTPASHAILIMTLEPVWVAIMAAIWFGESMSAWQITGCVLIFTAVLLSRWKVIWQLLKG
ncbi:DMT family transporter [Thiothrix eikelboomii]|uniref:Threonine/homoserine efflux transporter RhtA n=1 Tax=Thiothrix eikelboomii TaxID=92487 RepID=A0A1T4WDF9_9GAMM|nr:DMT family transporter [Thiothrix eikelboomii]SKA75323.1 Threonine/homoserine efflux transporter RhtA [Thiothrix eikelboomii]